MKQRKYQAKAHSRPFDYDSWAKKQLQDNYDERRAILLWKAEQLASLTPSHIHFATALEFGCAEGIVINRLRELLQIERCFGIDISQTFLSFGEKNYPNIKFIQYDKFILPFVDHSLDLIILSDIIEHIHDLSLFFKEVKRVAKYGLLKVPLDRYLWRKLVSEPLRRSPSVGSSHPDGHIHEFWKKSFEGMLKEAGFNILGSKIIYEEINQPNYHITSGILKIRWYLDFKFKRLLPKLAHIIFGGQLFVFIST